MKFTTKVSVDFLLYQEKADFIAWTIVALTRLLSHLWVKGESIADIQAPNDCWHRDLSIDNGRLAVVLPLLIGSFLEIGLAARNVYINCLV